MSFSKTTFQCKDTLIGEYVLSFRWDCKCSPQVKPLFWHSCCPHHHYHYRSGDDDDIDRDDEDVNK